MSSNFIIIEVYYKHGENIITQVSNEIELKKYLINALIDEDDEDDQGIRNMNLTNLINNAIGKMNDSGYTIVAIIKGVIIAQE